MMGEVLNCETCKEHKELAPVPYLVHESAMARNERSIKRLVWALIIAVFLIFASNAAWLYVWQLYDYSNEEITENYSYSQDGKGLNIIGDRNVIDNGPDSQNSSEN